MRNFRMILQYEGTRYQGWQRQESTENTIQGKLEAVLGRMLEQKIEVQGAGRTDAGVHALGQVAHFHADTEKSEKELLAALNSFLPEDIAVVSLKEVSERFHSRLNATGKTYCYRVINSALPHVFERRYAHRIEQELDVKAMQRAAGYLVGTHDFKAFTSNKRSKKSTVRTIESIQIERRHSSLPNAQADEILFLYKGNGFLYHMVRIITGTLLEVGAHKRKPEEIAEILSSMDRQRAGELAPAKGLTLVEVRYQ